MPVRKLSKSKAQTCVRGFLRYRKVCKKSKGKKLVVARLLDEASPVIPPVEETSRADSMQIKCGTAEHE